MGESLYWLGFSAFHGIGPSYFEKLLKNFGSAKDSWKAKEEDLKSVLGVKLATKFIDFRNTFSVQNYARQLKSKHILYSLKKDKDYPPLLKNIKPVPPVLYIKGDPQVLLGKAIAVVGTRKITSYGKDVTNLLVEELVAQGFVIVSGLALGVDAASHMAAIENGGKTIAALGSGVDVCVPMSNYPIYKKILEGSGCVVSQFALEEAAGIGLFPARNRIIAGLSLGVVVTEGAQDSGALITANFAKEFGRPIFAVPGPITSSLSKATNSLIKEGATAVTCAKDILDKLGIITKVKSQNSNLKTIQWETKEEKEIVELLEKGPLHFDEIVRRIEKDSKALGGLLSLMELKGMIKCNQEGDYTLN